MDNEDRYLCRQPVHFILHCVYNDRLAPWCSLHPHPDEGEAVGQCKRRALLRHLSVMDYRRDITVSGHATGVAAENSRDILQGERLIQLGNLLSTQRGKNVRSQPAVADIVCCVIWDEICICKVKLKLRLRLRLVSIQFPCPAGGWQSRGSSSRTSQDKRCGVETRIYWRTGDVRSNKRAVDVRGF